VRTELPGGNTGNTHFPQDGNAESNAVERDLAMHDADLADVVAGWPSLTPEAKQAVLRLVRGE
jgi:hypothetical protein